MLPAGVRTPAPRPLHVLMTADTLGGVWTYAMDLAAGLARRGVAVTIAVMGPAPSAPQRQRAARASVRLVETDTPLDWTARHTGEIRDAARRLAEVAAELRPDVIHLNSPALAAFADFEVPVLGVCHSCLATWWQDVKGGDPPPDFGWRIEAAAKGYAACSALVAPSRSFAAATARAYAMAAPQVIPNGRGGTVDAGADRPPPVHRLKGKVDLPFEANRCTASGSVGRLTQTDEPSVWVGPLVLTAGRLWDEGKDVATLDRAARRIEARCVALGATEAPDGTRIRFEALEAPGALGDAEVAAWMGKAQVFASAALYEPFGLAVLEAAQAGTALVLSDIPTFRELWEGAALFVAPGDAAGFAAAINGLLASPEARLRASRAATARGRRYTSEAMTEGYAAVYGRLRLRPAARPAQEARA